MKNFISALLKPDDDNLFGRAMSAGVWATALRIVLGVSVFLRTVVLARLLVPDDFGLMAIATISILFVERFTESGVEAALVQRKDDINKYLNSAWTLQIIRGLSVAALLALAAPLIAQFFDAPESETIIRVLALGVAAKGFTNIAIVYFTKELRFDRFFLLELSGRGVDVIVSIAAAFALRNVWALVIGSIAGVTGRLIASYVIDPYRPRFQWVWDYVKLLFNYGKWVLAQNFLNFATMNIDDIIVGRVLGVESLGLYRMAYNLSQTVATEITVVANQVAFPTYSKLQDAKERLRAAYTGNVHLVAFLGLPIGVGIVVTAPELVIGLLGDRWAPIVLPLQLMSIAGIFRGVGGTIGPLFQSQGRPDVPPRFSMAKLILLGIMLYPAINQWGINGAAAVVALSGAITGTAAMAVSFRLVRATWSDVMQSLVYPIVNTAVMAIVVLALGYAMEGVGDILALAAMVIVGGITYFASVGVTSRYMGYRAAKDAISRVKQSIAT